MLVIRCETGDNVTITEDTLEGARLSGLNLHRALLDGQVLRGADLSGTELRSAWLEGASLTLQSTINALNGPGGDAIAAEIPAIRIFERGGAQYTLDNRRAGAGRAGECGAAGGMHPP